jgi:hypothetical protein
LQRVLARENKSRVTDYESGIQAVKRVLTLGWERRSPILTRSPRERFGLNLDL